MTRSLKEPYYPNPVPTDPARLQQYLFDEFNKIKDALVPQPVALAIEETDTYVVGTLPNWVQAFVGGTPAWDVPGGSFDSVTGFWTCPQQGLYSADIQLKVEPFGSGNKQYYAGVRLYKDSGGVVEYRETTDGGDDAVPLGVTLSGLLPLLQGDILGVEFTIVHDQFTGVADYNIGWQMLRVS
jgi:hypothetical protein